MRREQVVYDVSVVSCAKLSTFRMTRTCATGGRIIVCVDVDVGRCQVPGRFMRNNQKMSLLRRFKSRGLCKAIKPVYGPKTGKEVVVKQLKGNFNYTEILCFNSVVLFSSS